MTDSPRKLIRHAVAALLETPAEGVYPTPAENRVVKNLVLDIPRDLLPALAVYTLEERPEGESEPDLPLRVLILIIEAHAGGKQDVDDFLDDVAWAAEQIIADNPGLGLSQEATGIEIKDLAWDGAGLARDASGAIIAGRAFASFRVEYVWRKPAADWDLEDFERVHGAARPEPGESQPQEQFRAEMETE